ncbi:MAG: hypothetical protein HGA97_01755 [Chlorobiaceae bacterium]|nr:hypothetical protein [Chlorobiaceae bacterium]
MLKENAPREALPYGKKDKPIDLFGFIKRYGLFILGIGAFLFTITVPFILLISKPNFEVHALLRIDPVTPSVITKSEDPSIMNYYSDYANTQAHSLLDYEILKKTAEKLTPEQKESIFPKDLPSNVCAEILSHLIKVSQVPGTHLLELNVSGPRKKGLAPLLNNLMELYLDKVMTSNQLKDNKRLDFLRNEKEALGNEITSIEDKLNILTTDISTADFAETYNMANKKLEGIQQIAVSASYERITSQQQFQEVENNNRGLQKLSLEPMVEERVMGDQSLHSTSAWTYQQQQQLSSTTDGLTPGNPDRIYVQDRMKAMRDYENKLRNEVRSSSRQIIYGKNDYERKKELLQSRNKADKAKNTESEILGELEKARNESIRISLGLHLGESLKAKLKHKRDLLDQIDTRIHELELEGKAPLHIAIESYAREPDEPAGSNTKKLMMVFFGLSFGSVLVLFFGIEYFDNRIRRKEEIKQALGYPPAKEIPKADAKIPFHRILELEPEGSPAQIIRSLAVKFVHEKKVGDTRVIMFSGVERQAGTTSLCFNCAQALTTLVPKVLIIEVATNSPPLKSLTGLERDPEGLTELLRTSEPLDAFISKGKEGSPDILYYGKAPGNDLPQQRIAEMIRQLRELYDIICIDCDPVLQSSLTEHFSLHSDIIALIVLGDSSLFRDLRASAEMFVRLEVPAIMPLLNRGSMVRATTIDKLLEKPPQYLDKIATEKIEELLRNLPSLSRLLETPARVFAPLKNRLHTGYGKRSKKKNSSTPSP